MRKKEIKKKTDLSKEINYLALLDYYPFFIISHEIDLSFLLIIFS